jgi:hypothetical protein
MVANVCLPLQMSLHARQTGKFPSEITCRITRSLLDWRSRQLLVMRTLRAKVFSRLKNCCSRTRLQRSRFTNNCGVTIDEKTGAHWTAARHYALPPPDSQPAPWDKLRTRVLNPFQKICTPMHTSKNEDSRTTMVIPLSPSACAKRSANP